MSKQLRGTVRVVRRVALRETVNVEVDDNALREYGNTVDAAIALARNGEHSDPYDREYSEEAIVGVWMDVAGRRSAGPLWEAS